jgi:tetratricopeptide (TPR) repeat protein
VDHQIQQQLGQTDKARKSLEAALALAGKNSNLAERATWLRSIAQLGDAAAQEQMDTTTATLESQLEKKSGLEKAQALSQLAFLYAQGGLPARAEKYRRMAQSTAGLSPAESAAINTDLIVRSDLAMARVLQGLGRYAEAEAMLQRVGGYLF